MKLYTVFAYRGDTWDDIDGRICISSDYPSIQAANDHANELKGMFGCNADIIEREMK